MAKDTPAAPETDDGQSRGFSGYLTGGDATAESDNLFAAADLEALEESDTYVPERSVHIPDEIKTFVEKAFDAWKGAPTKWRHVKQSSESAANTLISAAKLYARDIRDEPLTVQVKTPYTDLNDGTGRVEIVYRVREQIRRKPSVSQAGDAETPPAGDADADKG